VIRDVTIVIRHHTHHGRFVDIARGVCLVEVEKSRDLTCHPLDVTMQQGSHASIIRDGIVPD
jgi:hypothetical protein